VNHVDTASTTGAGAPNASSARRFGTPRSTATRGRGDDKGGFLPFDGERPDDPAAYVRERFIEPEIVAPDDLANRAHAIAPDYLEWSLDRSLNRLGLDTVDCYYVHNPETQLVTRSREAVYDQLETAFEALERRRTAGDIGAYGVATWHAFRVAGTTSDTSRSRRSSRGPRLPARRSAPTTTTGSGRYSSPSTSRWRTRSRGGISARPEMTRNRSPR